MSFIVRGIDIPKDDGMITLQILSSGAVYSDGKMICEASAIEIPTPHGRLGDLDNIYIDGEGYFWFSENEAPTIIEAEE